MLLITKNFIRTFVFLLVSKPQRNEMNPRKKNLNGGIAFFITKKYSFFSTGAKY